MLHITLDQINRSLLERLITEEIPEGKWIDYKSELPGFSESCKKEYAADVCSFANADGGYIIYGIDERRDNAGKCTGIPERIVGLDDANLDEAMRRLDQILDTAIEPRLVPRPHFVAIKDIPDGPVLVLKIEKSWNGPHMVATGESRFYSRNSNRKFPMDAMEIRSAFLRSESIPGRIRAFHKERIQEITTNRGFRRLADSGKIILHLIPFSSFATDEIYDIATIQELSQRISLFDYPGKSSRVNLDGVLLYSPGTAEEAFGYIQLYRSGIIEAVEATGIVPHSWNQEPVTSSERGRQIPPIVYGECILKPLLLVLGSCLPFWCQLGVAPPAFLFLTLTGVGGATILHRNDRVSAFPSCHFENYVFDRAVVAVPETRMDDFEESPERLLRDPLDALWQASGISRCTLYDENGNLSRL